MEPESSRSGFVATDDLAGLDLLIGHPLQEARDRRLFARIEVDRFDADFVCSKLPSISKS